MSKGLTSKQMSKLYWKQRRIKSHSSSFKLAGLAKALSKKFFNSKWKKGKFGRYKNIDFDGDGKTNKFDCKPFNKYKQDKYSANKLIAGDKYFQSIVNKDRKISEDTTKNLISHPFASTSKDKTHYHSDKDWLDARDIHSESLKDQLEKVHTTKNYKTKKVKFSKRGQEEYPLITSLDPYKKTDKFTFREKLKLSKEKRWSPKRQIKRLRGLYSKR